MKHRIFPAIALGLALATPAAAFDITNMNDAEKQALRDEIRAYLLDNPEVIMEAVSVLEARQAEAQASEDSTLVQVNADALFNDPNSWVGGNPSGDITLVEFVDYRCGYCRKAHDEVAELIESDGNIRFIVKDFPILGDASTISAQFALAVKELAGDDAYHRAGEALIKLKGNPEEPVLRRLAGTLGVDADEVMAKMESDEVAMVIAENHALAQRLKISGTPTFVMGDQMLRGYLPLDGMRGVVDELRAKE